MKILHESEETLTNQQQADLKKLVNSNLLQGKSTEQVNQMVSAITTKEESLQETSEESYIIHNCPYTWIEEDISQIFNYLGITTEDLCNIDKEGILFEKPILEYCIKNFLGYDGEDYEQALAAIIDYLHNIGWEFKEQDIDPSLFDSETKLKEYVRNSLLNSKEEIKQTINEKYFNSRNRWDGKQRLEGLNFDLYTEKEVEEEQAFIERVRVALIQNLQNYIDKDEINPTLTVNLLNKELVEDAVCYEFDVTTQDKDSIAKWDTSYYSFPATYLDPPESGCDGYVEESDLRDIAFDIEKSMPEVIDSELVDISLVEESFYEDGSYYEEQLDEEIIQKRRRQESIEYYHEFTWKDDPNAGFSFPCDKEGNLEKLSDAAQKNYQFCIDNTGEKIIDNGVRKRIYRYIEPAVMKCDRCKEEFYLENEYMGACQCPSCGQWYNLFGQKLNPPETWEE